MPVGAGKLRDAASFGSSKVRRSGLKFVDWIVAMVGWAYVSDVYSGVDELKIDVTLKQLGDKKQKRVTGGGQVAIPGVMAVLGVIANRSKIF